MKFTFLFLVGIIDAAYKALTAADQEQKITLRTGNGQGKSSAVVLS